MNPAALNSFNYKMTMTENAAKAAADKIICVAIYLSGLRGVIATTGRKITSKREEGWWWSAPLLSARSVGCTLAASTNGQVAVLVRGRSVGGAGSVVH